jgi:hypothetical protein
MMTFGNSALGAKVVHVGERKAISEVQSQLRMAISG